MYRAGPSRRRRAGTHVAAALVAVAVLVAGLVVASQQRGGGPSSGHPCGGHPIARLDGTLLACTFDDEFDAHALDPAKWRVETTARYGFHSGGECYVDDGRHVRVSDGMLWLFLTQERPSGVCARLGLTYQSGMVDTSGRFAQTYGRFAIRAALPGVAGSQPALWLYPKNLTYGRWPASGEIDLAEAFGSPSQTWPHLHYLAKDGRPAQLGSACPLQPGFHTYVLDWSARQITFRYDGATCLALRTWSPAPPEHFPAPFDRPFFLLLELAAGVGANAAPGAMRTPLAMAVDYVRVWGRPQ